MRFLRLITVLGLIAATFVFASGEARADPYDQVKNGTFDTTTDPGWPTAGPRARWRQSTVRPAWTPGPGP